MRLETFAKKGNNKKLFKKSFDFKGFPIILHVIRKGAEVKQLEGCSFHNRHEIDVVLKYIKLLQDTVWISEDEIGVISPYKQQAN